MGDGKGLQVAGQDLEQDQTACQEEASDEHVGGGSEDLAGLPDPQQVAVRDQPDEQERQDGPHDHRQRHHRADRLDARSGRDRNGQHVVHQERNPGQLRREQPQFVLGDDVGAAGGRVRLDRLAIREDQDHFDQHDHPGERHDQGERGQSDRRDEDPQDLLGGIGHRGHVVRGEHRHGDGLAESLMFQPGGGQGLPEQQPLEEVPRRGAPRPPLFGGGGLCGSSLGVEGHDQGSGPAGKVGDLFRNTTMLVTGRSVAGEVTCFVASASSFAWRADLVAYRNLSQTRIALPRRTSPSPPMQTRETTEASTGIATIALEHRPEGAKDLSRKRGRGIKMSSMRDGLKSRGERLERLITAPGRRRTALAFLVAVAGPALLTGLASIPSPRGTAIPALLYLLIVVAAAAIGHLWPALLAAGLSFILLDYFFTAPVHTFVVSKAEDLIALGVFLVVAATVSAAISAALAQRAKAEAREHQVRALYNVTARLLSGDRLDDVLRDLAASLRMLYSLRGCRVVVLDRDGREQERAISGVIDSEISSVPLVAEGHVVGRKIGRASG